MFRSVSFGPSGSGAASASVMRRYGSGFFLHQGKIVRKPFMFIVLYDLLSLKNNLNVPPKCNSNTQNNEGTKKIFFVGVFKFTDKKGRVRSRIRTKMSRIRNTDTGNNILGIIFENYPNLNFRNAQVCEAVHWYRRKIPVPHIPVFQYCCTAFWLF